MSVLFMMHNWNAPSELWLERQIEALEPHIAVIACKKATEDHWRDRIPARKICGRPPRLYERALGRIGLHRFTYHTAESQLEALIQEFRIRRVFVHYLHYALEFEALWKRLDIPLFVHSHGYDMEWDTMSSKDPTQRMFPLDYCARVVELSKRATIIANSIISATKLYAAGIPEDRVLVKYYGVPLEPLPARRRESNTVPNVLYLGRLVDFKGPDLVIRAFERACELGFRGNLTIAGDGAMRATCDLMRNQSTYRDRIKMLGTVDAAIGETLRAKADIFTAHNCVGRVSRREEALGVSILEAMSAGLPVITGRSGGVTETISHNETGFLVKPYDIDEHAQCMALLGSNPDLRERMGKAGRKRVETHFSIQHEKKALYSILDLDP